MQRPDGMGIVEVEGVTEGTVEEGGAGRSVTGGVAEDGGVPGGEAQGADGGEEGGRALGVMPGSDDVADEVEDQEACAGYNVGRELAQADGSGEGCEVLRDTQWCLPDWPFVAA